MKECCGNCKYHQIDEECDDWMCCNPESDYYGAYTNYNYRCEDIEEKECQE